MIIEKQSSNLLLRNKIRQSWCKMDRTESKDISDTSSDTTLFNFGYAPKEVIEKFQFFCYQYSTLTEAIQSLLKRDKLLKYKYRFKSSPVTYQMLAKPTVHDEPGLVKLAMCSLHKYMKQSRYKSVADAVEELLFACDNHKSFSSVGVNTSEEFDCNYTSISLIEQEALSKIADAVMLKLNYSNNFPARKKPKRSESTLKEPNTKSQHLKDKQYGLPKERKHSSPKEKKHRSPKEKVKLSKSSSPKSKAKCKDKKFSDPDYDPDGKKCLWNKFNVDSIKKNSEKNDFNSMSVLPNHQSVPVDIEIICPLKRLSDISIFHGTSSCAQKLNFVEYQSSKKLAFMIDCLHLQPQTVMEST